MPAPGEVEKAAEEVRLYHCQLLTGLRTDELSMMSESGAPKDVSVPPPQRYADNLTTLRL